jgi:hypothetical protein
VRKSVVFQTVASVNKKLDKISIKHLTINKTLDILKSSIKHLIIKFEFERGYIMKKIFDLPVCGSDRAKSFYGKAKIIETENGEKVLQSYNTFVCRITAAGRFVRMWGGYSATTMRHVNSFLSFYDMNGGGKAWWDMQPVETEKPKVADMTPAESLKAMYSRRSANSVNY